MTILYKVYNNLYVNLTNRCPCACTFCLRQTRDHMDDSGTLWLKKEPTVEEVIDEFKKYDLSQYKEIVFCGFGEPTEALDVLLPVAKYLKAHYPNPIRINTNGLGNLIHDRIIGLEKGQLDTFYTLEAFENAAIDVMKKEKGVTACANVDFYSGSERS